MSIPAEPIVVLESVDRADAPGPTALAAAPSACAAGGNLDAAAERRRALNRQHEHQGTLALATVIVALSATLYVLDGERVAFGWLPDYRLPPACMMRSLFHVPCPGCGLTRSFVYAAHGDFSAAWQMNRVGLLLALVVLAQFPYRTAALLSPGRELIDRRWAKYFGCLLIALLIINWIYNLATGAWH